MQDNENELLTPDESNISVLRSESIDEPDSPEIEAEIEPDVSEPPLSNEEQEKFPKEESRTRRAFRKFIRWTFGLLIVFGLGYLTAVFTIYNPKVAELDQTQSDLDAAVTTISELEAEINKQNDEIGSLIEQINILNKKIETLEGEKQELSIKQDSFNLQIALLKTRADVVSAQVKLYEENPTQARVLLESANQTLTTIETLLPDDLKDIVAPLKTRLELAIGGINDDPETAITDLSKIAGDLNEIENAKVLE